MGNKSSCCGAEIIRCDQCNTKEECWLCSKCHHTIEGYKPKKNSGLTLSEIYKQRDDIELFDVMACDGSHPYKTESFSWNQRCAEDWVSVLYKVLKRKSDQAEKEENPLDDPIVYDVKASGMGELLSVIREAGAYFIAYRLKNKGTNVNLALDEIKLRQTVEVAELWKRISAGIDLKNILDAKVDQLQSEIAELKEKLKFEIGWAKKYQELENKIRELL